MATKELVLVVEQVRISGHRLRHAIPEAFYKVVELSSIRIAEKQLALTKPLVAFVSAEPDPAKVYPFCRVLAQRRIPVIIMEKSPTRESVISALRNGAIDVIVSPPTPEMALSRFKRALVKLGRELPKARPSAAPKIEMPEDAKTPRSRVDHVIASAKTLLALPHAVSTVLRLCNEPQTSAADLVEPIATDTAIATSVFRLVNSAAMGNVQRVTDLKNAIARLGMKATSNLAMAQSVFEMFEKRGDTFGFDRTQYWIHCLGSACCARALAPYMKGVSPEDAFLGALLHDLGKMLLEEFLSSEFQEVVTDANLDGLPLRVAERQTFEVNHAFVGEQVSGHWGLPPALRHAIANHHQYDKILEEDTDDTFNALTRCVSLASQLAKAFGFGNAGDYLVETAGLLLWKELEGGLQGLSKLYQEVYRDLREFLDLLHIPAGTLVTEAIKAPKEHVLLCLPDTAVQYRVPLEAFFARCQCPVTVRDSLDGDAVAGGPYTMGITYAAGSMENAKAAAAILKPAVRAGLVFSDAKNIQRDGTTLCEGILGVFPEIDYFLMEKQFREILPPEEEGEEEE